MPEVSPKKSNQNHTAPTERCADVATLSPYLTQHIKRFGDYPIDVLHDITLTEEDDVLPLDLDASVL